MRKLAALACGLAVAAFALASALLELSQYVGGTDRARYRAFAVRQLLSLASPAYFSEGDEIGHFLLKHGVGHKPAKSEIDTPLDYGDYYFLEALLRFRELKAQETRRAATEDVCVHGANRLRVGVQQVSQVRQQAPEGQRRPD